MAKKKQGTSVEKRRRERDKMFKRREKEERRRMRKDMKGSGEEGPMYEIDPETGLAREIPGTGPQPVDEDGEERPSGDTEKPPTGTDAP